MYIVWLYTNSESYGIMIHLILWKMLKSKSISFINIFFIN